MAEFKPAPGTEAAENAELPQSADQALQAMDNMQLIYLLCLLAVIVVINWRFLGLYRVFGIGRPHLEGCEWIREETRETQDGHRHWVCMACGARSTTSRHIPRNCQRDGRP